MMEKDHTSGDTTTLSAAAQHYEMLHVLLPRFLRVMRTPTEAGGWVDTGTGVDEAMSALKTAYSTNTRSATTASSGSSSCSDSKISRVQQEIRHVQWLPDFIAIPGAFPLPSIGM